MALYRERGVVLRTHRLGEADRIVSLLTEGRGKVRAVAKGVRRPGSRWGARLEPASHVAVLVYRGRSSLDTITQAEAVESLRRLREHLRSLTAAMAILEATDQVAQEGEANPPLYRMLVGALRTLNERPSPVVAPAYFWKLLSLEGFRPELDACVTCGGGGDLVALDPGRGGTLCAGCAPRGGGVEDRGQETRDAISLIRRILGGGLREALAEPDGPAVREAERLAVQALEHHLERRLLSSRVCTSVGA